MKFPLFKQSNGEPSASFTMMMIGFIVCTLWLLLSIVETIAGIPIREFDAATAMAYFTPLAMLYFGRRWTGQMGQSAATGLINAIKGGNNSSSSVVPPSADLPSLPEDETEEEEQDIEPTKKPRKK